MILGLVLFHRILYAYDYQIIAVSITIKGIKLALASRVNEVVDMTWHDTTCPKTKLAEHLFREKKKKFLAENVDSSKVKF